MDLSLKSLAELLAQNQTLAPRRTIEVQACKFDGAVYRRWQVSLLEETADLWLLWGVFETEVRHAQLGVIKPDTISIEFYWKNRCYNVFRFHEPNGDLRNFYCNVNLPPTLSNDVLSYIDLDLDIVVQPDFSYQKIDFNEFAANAVQFQYPETVIKTAYQALDALTVLIENRQFPFNFKI